VKNANLFAENCQKSQKIVIITSTPVNLVSGIVQRVDYISDALGFRVAATNLPVHQRPIPTIDHNQVPILPKVINIVFTNICNYDYRLLVPI
jgi:hypothetical protein